MAEATYGLLARLSRGAGGAISFTLGCKESVVETLCITGVTLYGLYRTSKLLERAIDGIVNKGLEGHRTDQGICVHISQISYLLDIHDNLKYKQTKFSKRKDLLCLSEDFTYRFLCLTELLVIK